MLTIRPFALTDVEDVAYLMGELGYPTSPEAMRRRMEVIQSMPDYHTLVAELEGRVVGVIGLRKRLAQYESDDMPVQVVVLVTHSEQRGKGIGKALMAAAEQWARSEGAKSMLLTSGIKPERTVAHEFYKQRGFQVTGYRFVKALD